MNKKRGKMNRKHEKKREKREKVHMFGICMHIKTNKINKQTNKMCYQCVCITSVLILAYVQPS